MNEFEQTAREFLQKKEYSKLYLIVRQQQKKPSHLYYAYLGLCHENGYGVEKNIVTAISNYSKAVLSGATKNEMASDLFKNTYMVVNETSIDDKYEHVILIWNKCVADDDEYGELFWLKIAVEYDKPSAYYWLGDYYLRKNNKECFDYFKLAFDKGFLDAAKKLSYCYEIGFGVERNEERSMHYLKAVAETGDAEAQFSYAEKLFAKREIEQAKLWCRTASSNGHSLASMALCLAYDNLFQSINENDIEVLAVLARKNEKSEYILAILKLIGRYAKKDQYSSPIYELEKLSARGYKQATYALGIISLYELSESHNDRFKKYYSAMLDASDEIPSAAYALGKIFEEGFAPFCRRDLDKAYSYYERAAGANEVDAMVKIAMRHLFGINAPVDIEKGYVWFKKSCEISLEPEACACMGIIFEKGLCGVADVSTSEEWYARARKSALSYPNGKKAIEELIAELRKNHWVFSKSKTQDQIEYLTTELEVIKSLMMKFNAFSNKLEPMINSISHDVNEINERTKNMEELLNRIIALQTTISKEKHAYFDIIDDLNADESTYNRFVDSVAEKMSNALYRSGNASVDQEEGILKGFFGSYWDSLDEYTRKALVSARVFLVNSNSISYGSLDYSGVCISTCSALEQELKLRFFDGYKKYLKTRFYIDYSKWPKSMKYHKKDGPYTENKVFTIGNLPYIFGSKKRDEETGKRYYDSSSDRKVTPEEKSLLNEYIKTILYDPSKDLQVFLDGSDTGTSFLDRCEDVRCAYRNAAAHTEHLSRETAAECCDEIIGVSGDTAATTIGQVQGLLYELVKLTKPPKV